MSNATRQVPFGKSTLPIVSSEHLLVRKAMLDRAKDWLDIEQILIATDPLDLTEIEGWLRRMIGDPEPCLKKFKKIKARVFPSDDS